MADVDTRSLRRAQMTGDVQARSRWLDNQIKAQDRGVIPCDHTGKYTKILEPVFGCALCNDTGFRLFRVSVELMAYCGDEAARKLLGCTKGSGHSGELCALSCKADMASLDEWLTSLSGWGHMTKVRAATAAARAVIEECCCEKLGLATCRAGRRAIEAVEAWLGCPCQEHLEACERIGIHFDMGTLGVMPVAREAWWANTVLAVVEGNSGRAELAILQAVSHIGEPATREAICKELIGWLDG